MKFSVGINYWPAERAMYWWRQFDANEVARDFARIRAAGFDSVRIFLLWEDFQPAPDRIAEAALDRLVRVADTAARHQLSLIPTLFTGHMSGVNWIPEWALAPSASAARFRVVSGDHVVHAAIRNWYSDELIMRAQARLAYAVALTLRDHSALWAWDLGNENSNCVVPPSRSAADEWLRYISGEIRAADPHHPITMGLHAEDLEEDRRLGPREAARVCDFLCMHGYPIYSKWARSGTDPMVLPFLGLLTRWLGGRDVLFEEFGAPTATRTDPPTTETASGRISGFDEETAADFTRRALASLHGFGLTGAFVWCFSDYAQTLWTRPPLDEAVHERYFGLWRAVPKGTLTAKPALAEIQPWINRECCAVRDDFAWADISPDEFYNRPIENLVRLYSQFCERHAAQDLLYGPPPAD